MKKGKWKLRAGKGIAELETQEGFRNGWESRAWGGEASGVLEDEAREELQEESRAGNDEAREELQEELRAWNAVGTGESKIK